MNRWRVSIAGLMGTTVLLAVAGAGLLTADAAWAVIVPAGVAGLLLAAVVGAVVRTGQARAGWVGFAVFGAGYVALAAGRFPPVVDPSAVVRAGLKRLNLVKSYLPLREGQRVELLYSTWGPIGGVVREDHHNTTYELMLDNGTPTRASLSLIRQDNAEYYLAVGDSLGCLATAIAGAAIARGFAARERAKKAREGVA